MTKLISVVTPCYNEEENVEELYLKIKSIFVENGKYRYEHIFIDNASTDTTPQLLRALASQDKNVKVILNARNFGHIRSPYYGLLQSSGDAAILMASDFQDPPQLISEFIKKWEEGSKIVLGVKSQSEESSAMWAVRSCYYYLIGKLSEIKLTKNNTGFGLYDRVVLETLRKLDDPYPYFRGMISDLGYSTALVSYTQPTRKRGITKNNFYTLYDMAMLGITNHSKIPLRLATMTGFLMSAISFSVAMGYLFYKLLFWQQFQLGVAPVVIGIFFFSSIQLFFIGIIGEYIGSIHTQVLKRPLVIEKERIGF